MDVTREDLKELRADLNHGFSGVHQRLDVLNGRVRKGEISRAEHELRLGSLESSGRGDAKPITKRDLAVASATAAVVVVVLQMLGLLG
jgi:hypothetical protein